MAVGHMCNNNGFYFLLASLPLFLVQQRGFSIEQTSYLATLSYIAQAVAALFGGWISDRWSAGGRSEPSVRRGMLVVGQLPVGVAIIGLLVSDVNALSWLCLWLIVAGIGNGLGSLNLYAVAQMFAGSRASGTWVGVQNAVGNISGIVGPVVTGLIIDLRGSYVGGFWLAAGGSMAGAAWWDSCCRASRRPIWNSTGQ
jgi:MFS family permease